MKDLTPAFPAEKVTMPILPLHSVWSTESKASRQCTGLRKPHQRKNHLMSTLQKFLNRNCSLRFIPLARNSWHLTPNSAAAEGSPLEFFVKCRLDININ